MIVFLQLTTAGIDSGPFDLYSNLNSFSEPFEENVSRDSLVAGYSTTVPDNAIIVRITSKEDCISSVDITLRDVECNLEGYTGEITTTSTTSTAAPVNSVEWSELPYGYGGDPSGGFYYINGTVEIIGDPVTFRTYVNIPDNVGPGFFSSNIWVGTATPATERYVEVARPRDVDATRYSTSFTLPAGTYTWHVDLTWFGTGSGGEGGIIWTQ